MLSDHVFSEYFSGFAPFRHLGPGGWGGVDLVGGDCEPFFPVPQTVSGTYEERFQKTMLLLVFPGFRTSYPGRLRCFDSILLWLGALESWYPKLYEKKVERKNINFWKTLIQNNRRPSSKRENFAGTTRKYSLDRGVVSQGFRAYPELKEVFVVTVTSWNRSTVKMVHSVGKCWTE